MKKVIVFIFLLALILRVYKLSSTPLGFHSDEARVGWNALSILKTGMDDRGNKFAMYYDTFGDYRPTAIFYITIPSLLLFGQNEFAVRLPPAVLGAATVFPLFLMVRQILNSRLKDKKAEDSENIGLVAALLLAISPWHISVSRATSEVAISAFFATFGMYFLVKAINSENLKKNLLKSFVLFFVSYLFYHSIRILTPLFVFAVIAYFWKVVNQNSKNVLVIFLIVMSLLTVLFAVNPKARGRFSQVSIFTDLDVQHELHRMPFEEGPNKVFIARMFHNKVSVYLRRFITEYANYFSANFLIGKEAKPDRYTTTGIGVLTYVELTLFIIGLAAIAQKKFSLLPLLFLLAAPVAAGLTTEDSPNLHRAFYMVFPIVMVEAFGLMHLPNKVRKIAFILLLLNFVFFLHMYFIHAQYKVQRGRNFGAKELALYLKENSNKYDKIILTNIPDNPYPWIAFYGKLNPKEFNKEAVKRKDGIWQYKNYYFTGLRCPSKDAFAKIEGKILAVDADACATESKLNERSDVKIINEIRGTDEAAGEIYTFWSNSF